MARGKKTGGRNFKKGQNSRRGPDKTPRGSIKLLFKHYLMEHADTLYGTLKKIMANPKLAGPMIRDMRDTVDGKPAQAVLLSTKRETILKLARKKSPDG